MLGLIPHNIVGFVKPKIPSSLWSFTCEEIEVWANTRKEPPKARLKS